MSVSRVAALVLVATACGGGSQLEQARWFEPQRPVSVATGRCLVLTNGAVACERASEAPAPALTEPAISMAHADDRARCAVLASGRVACWGCSTSPLGSPLGFPTESELTTPPRLASTALAPVQGASRVAMGSRGACAIVGGGRVSCWGGHPLGTGHAYTSYGICRPDQEARTIDLPPALRIAVALDNQVCSVSERGDVYCAGSYFTHREIAAAEQAGKLTLPDEPTRQMKVPRSLDLAAGEHHFCSLGLDGSVWCWGANDYGQAGPRSARCPETEWDDCKVGAGEVPLPAKAVGITAGARHSCAVLVDARVACWGHNPSGALGFAGKERCFPYWRGYCSARPGLVAGVDGAIEAFASREHSIGVWAMSDDGLIVTWPSKHHQDADTRRVGGLRRPDSAK